MAVKTAKVRKITNSWETRKLELFNTRICDLNLQIKGSYIDTHIKKLYHELNQKKLLFKPTFYLTDSWGCPDQVPIIGIPFYLANEQLMRIEEEQTGNLEDSKMIRMLLRHETGHAINYAYRLWKYTGWTEIFGAFTRRYTDSFNPNPFSKQFVRHLNTYQYGRNYAQKHPDEDFAESFAVWLTPNSSWRTKYRHWPAIKKLKLVDKLIKQIQNKTPVCRKKNLFNPVDKMTMLLAEHYGQKRKHLLEAAQGYVDDTLKQIFPASNSSSQIPADKFIHSHSDELIVRTVQWTGLDEDEVASIIEKLVDRSSVLELKLTQSKKNEKLLDLTALCITFALNFIYTGSLNG